MLRNLDQLCYDFQIFFVGSLGSSTLSSMISELDPEKSPL